MNMALNRPAQYFSLRWNNYQNTMTSVFQQLREDQSFVDVTLSCENGSLKAHKVVLSACSTYFQKLLLENPCKHPTIILPADIIFTDLKTIIDFVYRGEIDVTESELQGLLRTAEQLKIKGLCETAETVDEILPETATTITLPETVVIGGQHQQQQQQQQQIVHTISSAANTNIGTIVATTPTTSRKSRLGKRSKSPEQLHQQQQQQQQHHHQQTILTTSQTITGPAIVSLHQTSSGSYIPVTVSGQPITTTTAIANNPHTNSDSENKVIQAKICKTEGGQNNNGTSGSGSSSSSSGSSTVSVSSGGGGGGSSATTPVTTVSSSSAVTVATSSSAAGSGANNNGNIGGTNSVAQQQQQQQQTGTAIVAQIVVRDGKDKNMTSLGMGMNGSLLGMQMGYLDFAPEPPAPSATPVTVTEHVDMSCTPSNDTRDLSNSTPNNGDVRIKFETLRSLDPTETLDIDNHLAQHIIQRLDQSPMHHQLQQHQQQQHHQQQHHHHHQQQHQQHSQHGNEDSGGGGGGHNLIQTIKTEVIEVKHHSQIQHHQLQTQSMNQGQSVQQQQQQQHQQQTQSHQELTGTTVMEIDPSQIKNEPGMIITPEIVTMMTPGMAFIPDIYNSDTSQESLMIANGSPNDNEPQYTNLDQQGQHDNKDALQKQNMSLTKASVTYNIPSTTLWQRAHRLGIETPKKEGSTKSWNEESLNNALEALRTGQISANKASKAYGIPSSTLYKIARREGIRLAAPFNAAPTTWTPEDLERALEAIRTGTTSVQKASSEYGIPTGTLYGRCKREGIELSRSNPTPWSEDAMNEALASVRVGQMSINQAAIHYNLPYSSLYGRFKRGKYDTGNANNSNVGIANTSTGSNSGGAPGANTSSGTIEIIEHSPENSLHMFQQQFQYSPGPSNVQQQTQHIQHHQIHHQIQQQDVVVTSTSQVQQQQHGQPQQQQQIQQIYHHHSTPERS